MEREKEKTNVFTMARGPVMIINPPSEKLQVEIKLAALIVELRQAPRRWNHVTQLIR